jgi:hypothetical protein
MSAAADARREVRPQINVGDLLRFDGVFISIGFGYVFYLERHALVWFMICLFWLGVGGANFAMYTLWLPEQYRTECRASAFAFATSIGRFGGAGITFLVGAGVAYYQSIGTPVALTSLAFVIGLLLLPFRQRDEGRAVAGVAEFGVRSLVTAFGFGKEPTSRRTPNLSDLLNSILALSFPASWQNNLTEGQSSRCSTRFWKQNWLEWFATLTTL